MKVLNFLRGDSVHLSVKTDQRIIDLTQAKRAYGVDVPERMEELINRFDPEVLELGIKKAIEIPETHLEEEQLTYAPCLMNPEKIICVGLNYVNHAEESKMEIPEYPILFSKFNNAPCQLIGRISI